MSEAKGASTLGAGKVLLGDSRSRRTCLLVLVAAMLVGGVRRLPEYKPLRSTTAASDHLDPAPAVAVKATTPIRPAAVTAAPGGNAEAIGNLLFRYDALIRQVEAQAVRAPDAQVDSALAELRELRTRTYAAARRTTGTRR